MKLSVLYIFIFVVLTGCKQEETVKNDEYYFSNADELKVLINQCEEKIDSTSGSQELESLRNDEVCVVAYRAKAGIQLGNLDKAKMSEIRNTFWSRHLSKIKVSRLSIEAVKSAKNL